MYDYYYQANETPQTLAVFFLSFLNDQNNTFFYLDSGATLHMTNNASILSCTKSYDDIDVIFVGNGDSLPISQVGDIEIATNGSKVKLNNILIVPHLKKIYFLLEVN